MSSKESSVVGSAKDFLKFINKSPSPFHAVEESKKRLLEAGFKELNEAEKWSVKPGDKFFLTRNHSTLVAFAVGGKFQPGNGFSIIGTHTDSPCLKIKPTSKIVKNGYLQVGVQLYGGGIWHTWFDRDLKLAGRVLIRNSKSQIEHKLVDIDKPLLRVSTVAIHLSRDQNEKFEFNKETTLVPILAMATNSSSEKNDGRDSPSKQTVDKHHNALLNAVANKLGCSAKDIIDLELCLADYVPGTIGGLNDDFIFCGRLDNLHSTYCALQGLLDSLKASDSLEKEPNIRMVSMFDNEEVGSESAQGAASALQEHILRRLSYDDSNASAFEQCICQSLLVSADMAHAVHPNFSEKHEEHHRPFLNKGVVLKFNANQKYASTAITSSIMREIAHEASIPIQDFVMRNDMACGSTIGPILSTRLGIPTLDLGSPQLSMHSIREMCSTSSVHLAISLFKAYFENYSKMYARIIKN
ncbi:hypothetical protein HELRODRAFT_187369 [Helobdella robusta]|uniref:Aspartyl aminopeptidase n=1 Tax=Helobdella robusta TaxID=6412 RepID=T1FP94_HELRO|nr:hypothetical protein HELRODRAFT_187369 [Helobdella robusta]ESN96961.1 hypothetical protein HELRODRAFT_187369 [Helobdella robusta]